MIWIPAFAAGKIEEPEGEAAPTLLFAHALLGLIYLPQGN
jgi:hypothetical protein